MAESPVTQAKQNDSIRQPKVVVSEAIFAVKDVRATIDYRKMLGFESDWLWGDPPTFGGARWGSIQVMFCQNPELAAKVEGHMHWFRADDVQVLYERHRSAGAQIISDIENKPWGVREYIVRDPNGYHLRFCGNEQYERPQHAKDSVPPEIQLAIRIATVDEYAAIRQAVNWGADHTRMAEALRQTQFGVVAMDSRAKQAVGMLRVCGDGFYYTIWDVMVVPSYQGQKIGSAMMEMAVAELRKIGAKGAFIGLFTPKPGFYERFGFRPDGGGMYLFL